MFSCKTNETFLRKRGGKSNEKRERSPNEINTRKKTSIAADLVVADEAGEELVLVGVAEGVVVPLVLHELLDALEDELEVVLQLELVHALLLALTGRHRQSPDQPTLRGSKINQPPTPKFPR
jgi:hypothetical protein